MISWTLDLMKKSQFKKIHNFVLDFSSAMLANIIHAPSTLKYLENKSQFIKMILESCLKLMREDIPVSVLMHILISLSYLSNEKFQSQLDEVHFVDRVSDFVEYYSQINTAGKGFC